MRTVSSWGRLSADEHEIIMLSEAANIGRTIGRNRLPGLAYGMGRSYGDVCLNPDGALWFTRHLDHFIAFDPSSGRLVCQAGVLLRDIQRLFVPRGWMLPVTPGTQLVTVGGAIANDVHGKNHHAYGSFGDHLRRIKLVRTDGEYIDCAPDERRDWFAATIGGLGLTGIIVEAEIQLRRVNGPWLETETIPYRNLHEFFELADSSESGWEHTVSWIDCLSGKGRGVFLRANPCSPGNLPEPRVKSHSLFLEPPISLINKWSLKPFNTAYYGLKRLRAGTRIEHYEPFFYPLDNLLEWNRMYGPKGFYQYQCVVPRQCGLGSVQSMLREIKNAGEGSFLAVLKTFGNRQPLGMLSFPMPGVTLALDFPNHGQKTHELFQRLDSVVSDAGGRIYPAKDARMPRSLFEAGYPQIDKFKAFRDPGISSGLSRRLMGS